MSDIQFFDVRDMIDKFYPKVTFFYVCGARGIGKSYSANRLAVDIVNGDYIVEPTNKNPKFLYLRKLDAEVQIAVSHFGNPFKTLNKDLGWDITGAYNTIDRIGFFYRDSSKEEIIGYAASVSTFSNKRSVDLSDVDFIFYDEIIKEQGNAHYVSNEGARLMHLYETISRNRELLGMNPVILLLASNPIDLADPLLSDLAFTPILNNMIFNHQERYTDYDRCLHIEKLVDHPVSEIKQNTSLYKFAKGTTFFDEAISGNFANNDLDLIKKVNLNEYKPIIQIENVCVYQHKSNGKLYVSRVCTPCNNVYRASETTSIKDVFYYPYKIAVSERRIYYESFDVKVVLEQMLNFK